MVCAVRYARDSNLYMMMYEYVYECIGIVDAKAMAIYVAIYGGGIGGGRGHCCGALP